MEGKIRGKDDIGDQAINESPIWTKRKQIEKQVFQDPLVAVAIRESVQKIPVEDRQAAGRVMEQLFNELVNLDTNKEMDGNPYHDRGIKLYTFVPDY